MFYDYFAILNINPDANKEEIKKAYRKQAMKWHPDVNNSPEAAEYMRLINEAYIILNDDEAREKYLKEYYLHKAPNIDDVFASINKNISDNILNNWIKQARQKAYQLNNLSLEEMFGTLKVAVFTFYKELFLYFLIGLISILFFFIFTILTK